MNARLLIVDDERIALRNLEHVLAKRATTSSPRKAAATHWNWSMPSPSIWC